MRLLNKEPKSKRAWKKREAVFEKPRARPEDYGLHLVEIDQLPMGLAKADLLLDYNGARLAYELQAGFIGIRQGPGTLALRPEINWLVVDTGR